MLQFSNANVYVIRKVLSILESLSSFNHPQQEINGTLAGLIKNPFPLCNEQILQITESESAECVSTISLIY